MENGWIKLYRKFTEWGWYKDSEMVHLFVHFLLLANHEDHEWQGHIVKKGQFITGRNSLSKDTGISPQTIRTVINKLKSTNEITTKSTNKFSLITITKWELYQPKQDLPTSKSTKKSTNDQPATNQQLTTNKNEENDKNEKNISIATETVALNPLIGLFKTLNPNYERLYKNSTQRKALERMVKKFGADKVAATIKYAVKVSGEKYAPTITTPVQLEERMGQLMSHYKRQKSKDEEGIIKVHTF